MTTIDEKMLPFRKQALERVRESISRIHQEKSKLEDEKISLFWEEDEKVILQGITDELRHAELLSEALGKVMQANFRRVEDQE